MNAASIPSSSNLRAFHSWLENNYDYNIHKVLFRMFYLRFRVTGCIRLIYLILKLFDSEIKKEIKHKKYISRFQITFFCKRGFFF